MTLPDRRRSHAVLIGVSSYTDKGWPSVAAAEANMAALRDVLSGPGGCVARENCEIVPNPRTAAVILEAVDRAASAASDMLLVYYVGHGLLGSEDGGFFLSHTETSADLRFGPATALDWNHLRIALRDAFRGRTKVVILDSCHSGAATGNVLGSSRRPFLDIKGTYVLPSCPANKQIPAGMPHTLFTGELIRLLKEGIASSEEYLTLDVIHRELTFQLRTQGLEPPPVAAVGQIGQLALAVNRGVRRPADLNFSEKVHLWRAKRADKVASRNRERPAIGPPKAAATRPEKSTESVPLGQEDSCVPPPESSDKPKESSHAKAKGSGFLVVIIAIVVLVVSQGTTSNDFSTLEMGGDRPAVDKATGAMTYLLSSEKAAVDTQFSMPPGRKFRRVKATGLVLSSPTGCSNLSFGLKVLVDGKVKYSAAAANTTTGAASMAISGLPTLQNLSEDVPTAAKTLQVVAEMNADAGCQLVLQISGGAVVDGDAQWMLGLR